MNDLLRGIDAVTFDFFNTLVFHREGHGRGAAVMRYLAAEGIECAPWRHEILYEIFDGYDRVGSPSAPPEERRRRRLAIAQRLFERLEIAASAEEVESHAAELWKLLGPEGFEVFFDVRTALEKLGAAGYRLAIISNWPKGLGHFCSELGLADYFEAILCSAEVGAAKPDDGIFVAAAARLDVDPGRILHVGDTILDDYTGASAAGFRAVLIDRESGAGGAVERAIHGLHQLTDPSR
jgi:HAD superfamily hydrolase (TIGR01549 family)